MFIFIIITEYTLKVLVTKYIKKDILSYETSRYINKVEIINLIIMKIEKAKPDDINDISKVELGSGYPKNRTFNPIPMLKQIFNDKKDNIFW